METKSWPPISQELIDRLSGIYRDELPRNELSQVALARLIGQQDVIRHLQQIRDQQIEVGTYVSK